MSLLLMLVGLPCESPWSSDTDSPPPTPPESPWSFSDDYTIVSSPVSNVSGSLGSRKTFLLVMLKNRPCSDQRNS